MRGCNKQTFYFRRAWQVLAQTSLSDPIVLYTLFPHIYWRQENCLLRMCITSYQCKYQWQNSIANNNSDEPSNDREVNSMALRGWALSVSSSKPLLYLCSSNMKIQCKLMIRKFLQIFKFRLKHEIMSIFKSNWILPTAKVCTSDHSGHRKHRWIFLP